MSSIPGSKTWYGPPPPAELTDGASSLQLLSQGAEARVWLVTPSHSSENDSGGGKRRSLHVGSGINVPQLTSFSQHPSPLSPQPPTANGSSSGPLKFICKERFPKKYRHPQLDVSLTKSRTKGEARSLVRCRRADVPCPDVLAIAHWSNKKSETDQTGGKSESNGTSTTSSCLFMECVEGCTVRQYFEQRSTEPKANNSESNGEDGAEPETKRQKCEDPAAADPETFQQEERATTVIDAQTLCVARAIGTLVAKMHAAGVIHGDLTTSNIMVRNPPQPSDDGESWEPQLVLIDFGLASSTATSNNKNNSQGGKEAKKPHKQQHNAEEKAVDLYVLERAFLSTHPESEGLVEEVWRGYRGYFEGLDKDVVGDDIAEDDCKSDAAASSCSSLGAGEGTNAHVAKAVLSRLDQVRMRGRKRECFG